MTHERDPRELQAIQQAREQYTLGSDDDIKIDDNPAVSVADGGIWVAAWVWVSNEEIDELCECGRKPEECATFEDKEAEHGDR